MADLGWVLPAIAKDTTRVNAPVVTSAASSTLVLNPNPARLLLPLLPLSTLPRKHRATSAGRRTPWKPVH